MINNKEFSIKETVNRNIEKHQFPHYKNHNSLIGKFSNYYIIYIFSNIIIRPEYYKFLYFSKMDLIFLNINYFKVSIR